LAMRPSDGEGEKITSKRWEEREKPGSGATDLSRRSASSVSPLPVGFGYWFDNAVPGGEAGGDGRGTRRNDIHQPAEPPFSLLASPAARFAASLGAFFLLSLFLSVPTGRDTPRRQAGPLTVEPLLRPISNDDETRSELRETFGPIVRPRVSRFTFQSLFPLSRPLT
jgi:hypothetical protein